jgi:hypothetical protein
MATYIRKQDVEVFKKHQREIEDRVEERRLEVFEPTRKEIEGVRAVIIQFIREKSRKVYGGHGHNILLKSKDPKAAIYRDIEYKDIEWYTTEPVQDMIEVCERLYKKGFPNVSGKEAQHPGTFKIFVNFKDYADITYVPRNIYNRIPFIEADGLKIVDPYFSFVDSLRTIVDMMSSGYRLEKVIQRGELLQRYFPLRNVKQPAVQRVEEDIHIVRNMALHWLQNRETTVLVGEAACEYYRTLQLMTRPANMQRVDIISTRFARDCYELYHRLKQAVDEPDKLMTMEYYPFFQFTGHRFSIWYKGKPIAQVFTYNKICTPYRDVGLIMDVGGKEVAKIRVGTFSLVLLYNYIMAHMSRINRERDDELFWRYQIQSIVEARNRYLEKRKKTIYDETPYQEFRVECIGKTVDPPREMLLRRKELHKQHRAALRYEPEEEHANERKRAERFSRENQDRGSGEGYKTLAQRQEEMARIQFLNESGNPVNKERNLKVRLDQPPRESDTTLEEAVAEDDTLEDEDAPGASGSDEE